MLNYLRALTAILFARTKYGLGYVIGLVGGLAYFYGRAPLLTLGHLIATVWFGFWCGVIWPGRKLMDWADRKDTFLPFLMAVLTCIVLYATPVVFGAAALTNYADFKRQQTYRAYIESLIGKTVVEAGYSPTLERWYVVVEDTPNHTEQIWVDYHTAIEAIIGRPYHRAHR